MWGRIIVAFFLYTPGRTSLSFGASGMSGGCQNREEIVMDRCERSRVGYRYRYIYIEVCIQQDMLCGLSLGCDSTCLAKINRYLPTLPMPGQTETTYTTYSAAATYMQRTAGHATVWGNLDLGMEAADLFSLLCPIVDGQANDDLLGLIGLQWIFSSLLLFFPSLFQ